jgi:hypothetical protein
MDQGFRFAVLSIDPVAAIWLSLINTPSKKDTYTLDFDVTLWER